MEHLLELHRRFHKKVGCPGENDCYVCKAESIEALKARERELLEHGDPLSGDDYQAMQDIRKGIAARIAAFNEVWGICEQCGMSFPEGAMRGKVCETCALNLEPRL